MKEFLTQLKDLHKDKNNNCSNNYFQAIFENHSAIMLMIDPENKGFILDANKSACDFYGYTKAQLREMTIGQLTVLPNNDKEIKEFGKKSIENNYFQFKHRIKGNQIRDVEFHSSSILIDEHMIIFAIIHDITDRMKTLLQIDEFTKEFDKLYDQLETRNKEIERDLAMAKQIQLNLIPSENPKNTYSIYQPMDHVGGDFYDFIHFQNEEKIGLFISDVSGHGVQAALITTMLKTLIETAGELRENPKKLLAYINYKLYGITNDNFLTAFYGIYNKKTKKFLYCRAAHNYPFLIRNNKIIQLRGRGKILGFFKDIELENKEIQLKSKDRLFFYTDGLTEAQGLDNKKHFEEKLLKLLLKYKDLSVHEYIEKIYEDLLLFTQEEPFKDDICVIASDVP